MTLSTECFMDTEEAKQYWIDKVLKSYVVAQGNQADFEVAMGAIIEELKEMAVKVKGKTPKQQNGGAARTRRTKPYVQRRHVAEGVQEYGRVQNLYSRNRKELVTEMLEGKKAIMPSVPKLRKFLSLHKVASRIYICYRGLCGMQRPLADISLSLSSIWQRRSTPSLTTTL